MLNTEVCRVAPVALRAAIVFIRLVKSLESRPNLAAAAATETTAPICAVRVAPARPVMDPGFSYELGLVKCADDKLYLRMDYSNQPRY